MLTTTSLVGLDAVLQQCLANLYQLVNLLSHLRLCTSELILLHGRGTEPELINEVDGES